MSKLKFDGPQVRCLREILIAAFATLMLVASGPAAQALSLQDLADGAELNSASGNLTFENFEVSVSGSGSLNLADYSVDSFGSGFGLSGTKDLGFHSLNLSLSYDVVMDANFSFAAINVSSGALDGANAIGLQAFDGDSELTGASWQKFYSSTVGSAGDASAATSNILRVVESMVVFNGDAEKKWSNTRSFESSSNVVPVPEPNTALLIGFGLMGLAGYSRSTPR